MAGGCSNSEASSAERHTATSVEHHIESIGVKTKQASCIRQGRTTYRCALAAKNGATIKVEVTESNPGQLQYQTLSGLIDGPATARRLEQIWTQQSHLPAKATCPNVIAANSKMSVVCTLQPEGRQKRQRIRVTILDDKTGDFTYKVL